MFPIGTNLTQADRAFSAEGDGGSNLLIWSIPAMCGWQTKVNGADARGCVVLTLKKCADGDQSPMHAPRFDHINTLVRLRMSEWVDDGGLRYNFYW